MNSKPLKWLQWAADDLERGVGGVQNHARCLGRELAKNGVDVHYSTNGADLYSDFWDVIHTHGSHVRAGPWLKSRVKRGKRKRPVRVFTHHGLTHERMIACHELAWPGGYRAALRELTGAITADVILSVNQHIHDMVKHLAPVARVCLNAWDTSPGSTGEISPELRAKLENMKPFWAIVGRCEDRMKGAYRVPPILDVLTDLRLVACPGQGFENENRIFKTGRQETSERVLEIIRMSSGLISTSVWETGPIVVLEALAQGVPVVCTPTGLNPNLPLELQGFFMVKKPVTSEFVAAIQKAGKLDLSEKAKDARARANRLLLPSWGQAAKIALDAVQEFISLGEKSPAIQI